MNILEIYDLIFALGLSQSQIEFSEVWLGRSPRYYSHLIASGNEPGVATLVALNSRIVRVIAEPGTSRDAADELKRISSHISHSIALRSMCRWKKRPV